MTKQIYYSNWSDRLDPEHENYWEDISNISTMIGNDLIGPYQMNYYVKKDEYYLNQISSIAVLQTKEKFGEVRVYCRLGCEQIISEKYKREFDKAFCKNKEWRDFMISGKKPKHYSKSWEEKTKEAYPFEPKDKNIFREECELYDVKHYRSTYFKYYRLFPHYKSAIGSGASHPEYLMGNKEDAEEHIYSLYDNFDKNKKEYNWDEEFCAKRKNMIDKNCSILKKLYNIK